MNATTGTFEPDYSIKKVCSWCGELIGLVTCAKEDHGTVTHGICQPCEHKHFPEPAPRASASEMELKGMGQ